MHPGIPGKRPDFRIAYEADIYFNCLVDGDLLYLLSYDCTVEDRIRTRVKAIDLNDFDGNLDSVEPLLERDDLEVALINDAGEFFILVGNEYSVYRKKDGSKLEFSTAGNRDEQTQRRDRIFRCGDALIRQVDLDQWHQGIEFYDLGGRKVSTSNNLDIKYPTSIDSDTLAGTRASGNFGVYSLSNAEYIYEVDHVDAFGTQQYPTEEIWFDHNDSQLAIAYGPSLLVVCMNSWKVLRRYNFLDYSIVKDLAEIYQLSLPSFVIRNISFHDDWIVVNGNRFFSYVACINMADQKEDVRWLRYDSNPTLSIYTGGDLVFGKDKGRPIAWDINSGDIVWLSQGTSTAANRLLVGDSWVIYPPIAGDILCFRWRKPYLSTVDT